MKLSTLIKTKRFMAGLSQKELAKRIGCNSNMIFRIECRDQVPNFKAACMISEEIDLDIRIMKRSMLNGGSNDN